MDYAALRFWLDVVVLVGVVLNTLYTWHANRNRATRAAIDRVDRRVDDLGNRMSAMETDLRHQPSHNDLKRIYEKLDALAQAQATAGGELKAVTHQLSLINRHLLKVES